MIEPQTPERPSWRNSPNIAIHPTAELFPLLPPDELAELAEDIKANRLREKAAVITKGSRQLVIDGRNRLDALECAGFTIVDERGHLLKSVCVDLAKSGDLDLVDPAKVEAFIISKNIHRRHLATEDRKRIAAELLKANPARSNRSIAAQTKLDDKTVAQVRKDAEVSAEIPHIDPTDRVDTGGRKRARKTGNTKAGTDEEPRAATKDQPAPAVEAASAHQPTGHPPASSTEHPKTTEAEQKAEELRAVYTGVSAEVPQVQRLYLELSDQEQTYFWRWLTSQRGATPEPTLADLPFDAWLDQFKTRYASLTPAEQSQVAAAMGDAMSERDATEPEPQSEPAPVPSPEDKGNPGDRVSRIVARFHALTPQRQSWVLDKGRLDKAEDTINHIKKNDNWADVHNLLTAYVASSATEQAAFRAQVEAAPEQAVAA